MQWFIFHREASMLTDRLRLYTRAGTGARHARTLVVGTYLGCQRAWLCLPTAPS